MNKQYRELNFYGYNIESVVNKLLEYKEEGRLVSTDFNGVMLYSDTVTLNGAYKSITGLDKEEFDAEIKKQLYKWEEYKRQHEESIPQLTKFWVSEAKKVLDDSKWELWEEIVPVRLGDLYQGMELGCALNIIKELNKGDFEKAKDLMEKQDHSGMSHSLVCAMVKDFSDNGSEFVEMVK